MATVEMCKQERRKYPRGTNLLTKLEDVTYQRLRHLEQQGSVEGDRAVVAAPVDDEAENCRTDN